VLSITAPVRQVIPASQRSRLINLDLRKASFSFGAGQAVMVGLRDSLLRKPYSIASAPFELANTGMLQLLAQIDETGGLDPHLELAAPGTELDVEGPFGSFGLPADSRERPLLFVAGGTGIAPLRSMIFERVAQGPTPLISLVYSVRSPEDFAFRTELKALESAGRIRAWFTVTRNESGEWPGRRGRIDDALLREALPSNDALCLICGPPQLVADAQAMLQNMAVPQRQILVEKY
jgi:ferredoxin-NADP reductase